MARTDKREGRVKYYRIPALQENDQRRARYGKFADHPMLESVLICENRKMIEGGTPLEHLTPAEFAKSFWSRLLKHQQRVAAFKKKSRREHDEMLRVIDMNDGDGVDPRRRIANEEYYKMPLSVSLHRGVVYAAKGTHSDYVKTIEVKEGRKKVKKKIYKITEFDKHWRFRPALDFQRHLEKLYPQHFPPTETAESFMMFAKRAGLKFIGPKNAKTRRISKRLKR